MISKLRAVIRPLTLNIHGTLTFGDVGENHKGMQMIGKIVEKGEGYNLKNLNRIKKRFEKKGVNVN